MDEKDKLIKIGRHGILVQRSRIPASFFHHQRPGKMFVVLSGGERQLMHVRASDLSAIRRAYREYVASRETKRRGSTAG